MSEETPQKMPPNEEKGIFTEGIDLSNNWSKFNLGLWIRKDFGATKNGYRSRRKVA